ncbi:MAG: 4'-phosphopantetheinyl transferase superfamily protein [Desulfovibrionaceae bacterium]
MPGRVILLATANTDPWPPGRLERALVRLPPGMGPEVLALRRAVDRQARVLGRLLLRAGLVRLGLPAFAALNAWTRGPDGRPALAGCPADFNISHCAGLVLCALGLGVRVGVDAEPRGAADPRELRAAFTPGEWEAIRAAPDPDQALLDVWTAKEALLKADGRGFMADPAGLDARGAEVELGGVRWRLLAPEVGPGHVCRLAVGPGPGEMTTEMTAEMTPEVLVLRPEVLLGKPA